MNRKRAGVNELKKAIEKTMAETAEARKKRLEKEKLRKPWRTINRHWFDLYTNVFDRVDEDQKWTQKEIVLVNKMIKTHGVDRVLEMVTLFFDNAVKRGSRSVPTVGLMWACRDTLSKTLDGNTPRDVLRDQNVKNMASDNWESDDWG